MATNAQTEANKRWQEKNPEHARYLKNRSTARTFLRKYADQEDLDEMKQIIHEREKELLAESD